MKQKIVRFNRTDAGNWVAELACGHTRNIRHRPPWQNRPWVRTAEGREKMIGRWIECGLCSREAGNRADPGNTG